MGIFDKAKDMLNSDQAEEYSDKALDQAAKLATDKLGTEHADKITKIRDEADACIGNEDSKPE
ncbi:antitoxin [Trueperella pyogenes]|uniref:antitoxin n=1 Tax=Trueperella pyogenes TaxID=1661 RepID=UPI00345CB142